MKLDFSPQIFEKFSIIEFHEKSFHWYPSCSMRTDGQADMTKLIIVFRNSENAPKNGEVH